MAFGDDALSPPEAKKLLRSILEEGSISYSVPHSHDRMKKWNMTIVDVLNVLRAGTVTPAEYESDAWRYQVATRNMTVVAEFVSETEVFVVTCWRNK